MIPLSCGASWMHWEAWRACRSQRSSCWPYPSWSNTCQQYVMLASHSLPVPCVTVMSTQDHAV